MSTPGGVNPVTASMRDLPPGPNHGVPTDPNAHVAPDGMDSRAKSALTLGVLSLLLSVITGIPAIVVGRKALLHISSSQDDLKGRWAAWTGIALGCLSVIALVAGWLYLHNH